MDNELDKEELKMAARDMSEVYVKMNEVIIKWEKLLNMPKVSAMAMRIFLDEAEEVGELMQDIVNEDTITGLEEAIVHG